MINNALFLWIFEGLFVLRFFGQLIVASFSPSWLPPMEEWYSGLITYPILFSIQIAIIILMTEISWDNTKKTGYFFVTKPKTKIILVTISLIYFLIMLTRYILTIALVEENRWLTGAIPIFFHWILAAYLYCLTLNPLKE